MMSGKFDPGRYRGRHAGGGIAGMYSKKPYMIPVNPHATMENENKIVIGKQVTPTAAVEERAKSEMKEAVKDDAPHVPVGKNIKRAKTASPLSSERAFKGSTTVKRQPPRKKRKRVGNSEDEKPNVYTKFQKIWKFSLLRRRLLLLLKQRLTRWTDHMLCQTRREGLLPPLPQRNHLCEQKIT
ncbi:hypothetical protein KP79_PYT22810 [Mizuhopecten yessoensis]|uniref:Uncharacterized protein n=1 Tax=Mizuhopecten yessoensis TaxID=6573 RepID=A0A210Q6M5_MIZYE|nr:hypothetical protein KP79_PYT22810 [Mizuhopecten yessoensis]